MDYSDALIKAVNDYFRPGSPKRPPYKHTYKFLSDTSRERMSLKEWTIYSKPYDDVQIESIVALTGLDLVAFSVFKLLKLLKRL